MEKEKKWEGKRRDEVDDDNHNQARNSYKMCVSNESSRLNDDSCTHMQACKFLWWGGFVICTLNNIAYEQTYIGGVARKVMLVVIVEEDVRGEWKRVWIILTGENNVWPIVREMKQNLNLCDVRCAWWDVSCVNTRSRLHTVFSVTSSIW